MKTPLHCLLVAMPFVAAFPTGHVLGQSITPAPDGTQTQVIQDGNRYDIQGGQLSGDGANLFHSFQRFGLSQGQIANFLSNPNIRNILGRVTGGEASFINGLIQVTGGNSNLYLMNPAGIIFGSNAQLNVPASFTATTANGIGFNERWFNSIGENNWATLVGTANQFRFDTLAPGSVINQGNLAVEPGQTLSLMGGTVLNTGTLTAPGGQIALTAVPGANLVRISQPGHLLSLEVTPIAPSSTAIPAVSLPQLLTGGDFSNQASGVTVDSQGQITLGGQTVSTPPGTTLASGQINVFGEIGGSIYLLGRNVGVIGANLEAAGTLGGGHAFIGGDYQGKGPLPNADFTFISGDSTVSADAITRGNGGRVIVWADHTTRFLGNIRARGGGMAGDGGFVEVSGKSGLEFQGLVDLQAPFGTVGTLLLDPTDITISAAPDSGGTLSDIFTPSAATSNINTTTLQNQVNLGNVTISTASAAGSPGNITVSSPLNFNLPAPRTLTLNADNDIAVNSPITNTGPGALNLNVLANNGDLLAGSGGASINSAISTLGGNIAIRGVGTTLPGVSLSATGSLNSGGGTINLNGMSSDSQGITIAGAINAAGGNITLTGLSNANTDNLEGIRLTNNSLVQTLGLGNITLNGTSGTAANHRGVYLSNNAIIQAEHGTIEITGTSRGTGVVNPGILLNSGGRVQTAGTGTINLTGTGGSGTDENIGVLIQDLGSGVFTNQGAINLLGTGNGTNGLNHGIAVLTGGMVRSITGNITLTGTGGNGSWLENNGIRIDGTDARVMSQDGNIVLTGNGNGTFDWGTGILVRGRSTIETTGTGNIVLVGTGSNNATQTSNKGILLQSDVTGNTILRSNTGSILITGNAGSNGSNDHQGVMLGYNGVGVTQVISNTGPIRITGNGKGSGFNNQGVILSGGASAQTSGNIVIDGTSTGTGINNPGVIINTAAFLQTLGTGNITVVGRGGNGSDNNAGIRINHVGSGIFTSQGAISLTGIGGNGIGAQNFGIGVLGGARVQSATGEISIMGTGGGAGLTGDHGIYVYNDGSITSTSGAITLQGQVGAGDNSRGILIENNNARIVSGGAITLTGNGNGVGTGNVGVLIQDTGRVQTTGTANLTIQGTTTAVAGSAGIQIGGNGMVAVGTGTLTLTGDEIFVDPSTATIQGTGPLLLQPLVTTQGITVGGTVNDANFNLDGGEIARLQNGFSEIFVGRADGSGTINLTGNATFFDPVTLRSVGAGGSITWSANSLRGADNATLTLIADQNITVGEITNPGQALTITSNTGDINTTAGTLNTSTNDGSAGGDITLQAPGNINTGILYSYTYNAGNSSNGGAIKINAGGNISILGGFSSASISEFTGSSTKGGDVEVVAGDRISVMGDMSAYSHRNYTGVGNAGDGGNITLSAVNGIAVSNGVYTTSQRQSGTAPDGGNSGRGGDINLMTSNGDIIIGGQILSFSETFNGNAGNSGAITLTANNGNVNISSDAVAYSHAIGGNASDGGAINLNASGNIVTGPLWTATLSDTNGNSGTGGPIQLNAGTSITTGDIITISQRPNAVVAGATGNGGEVFLQAGNILTTGAISTFTRNPLGSSGNGGNITLTNLGGDLNTSAVEINATSQTANGGVISFSAAGNILTGNLLSYSSGAGAGGNISLISSGAGSVNTTAGIVDASSQSGNGGTIYVQTTTGDINADVLRANAFITGNGGNITLVSGNNASVNTVFTSTPLGNAGPVKISAQGEIAINTGIFANSQGGGGSGNITLESITGNITTGLLDATSLGTVGGTVGVTANSGSVTFNSAVDTSAPNLAGNITVSAGNQILLNAPAPNHYLRAQSPGGSGTITLTGNTVLTQPNYTLETVALGSGGDIFVTNLDGSTPNTNALEVMAGTGNVTVNGSIGTAVPLGNLTVNSSGTTQFNGIANVATFLTDVPGTTQFQNSLVTTGTVNVLDAAEFTGNVTIFSNNNAINFGNTVNGAYNLTLEAGAGNITFNGAVGTVTPLGNLIANTAGVTTFNNTVNALSLTTDALGNTQLTGNLTTTGNITLLDPVSLLMEITVNSNNSEILFGNTVDGSYNFSLNSGTGNITFAAPVGSLTPLGNVTALAAGTTAFNSSVNAASLTTDASGTTQLAGNLTTTGPVTLADAVSLLTDITVNSNNSEILFGNTVDGSYNFSLNSGTGNITFAAPVGSLTPLGNMTVLAAGTTAFNSSVNAASLTTDATGNTQLAGNLTTTGNIALLDPVSLLMEIAVNSNNGEILFGNTVDGSYNFSLNSGTGNITFAAPVGSLTPLGNMTVLAAGTTTFNSTVNAASLTTDATGNTQLAGNLTTAGNITLSDPISLLTDITVNSNNGEILFGNTVDGGYNFSLNSGSGNITFAGVIGGITPLGNLIANSLGTTTFQSSVNATSLTTDPGGNTQLGGNITTTGIVALQDAVNLLADVTVNSNNQAIIFGNTVDGTYNLTLNAGTGPITFSNAVGRLIPLAELTVNSTGNTLFNSTIQVAGLTTDAGGTTQITGNVTASGFTGIRLNDATTLAGDLTLKANEIDFNNVVFGTGNLILEPFSNTQNIMLQGSLDTTALDLTASDIRQLQNGFSSITIGSVTGQGTISLANPATFADSLILRSPLGSFQTNGFTLTGMDNASLTVDAPALLNANLTTQNQFITFNHPVTLAGDVTIETGTLGGVITFNGTVDGTHHLSLNSGSQDLTFNQGIGTLTPLRSLTANSTGTTRFNNTINAESLTTNSDGTTQIKENITTNGAVNFLDAVVLNNPLEIRSLGGDITFGNTVDGSYNLSVTSGSGNITFNGAVGSLISLGNLSANSSGITQFRNSINAASLTTDAGGTTELAGNINTQGAINLQDAVQLRGSVAVNSNNQAITFGSTVDGTFDLTLEAGSNNITFNQAVGSISPLGNLILQSTGVSQFSSTVNATRLATNLGGTTQINGNVTTQEAVNLQDAVNVTGSVLVESKTGDIILGNAVTGGETLTLQARNGTITSSGTINTGTLNLSGNQINLFGAVSTTIGDIIVLIIQVNLP